METVFGIVAMVFALYKFLTDGGVVRERTPKQEFDYSAIECKQEVHHG